MLFAAIQFEGETRSMVTGFNHNIKHNGKVYHIQTEDSGVKAPHIITHLFVGGNIIATKKTSYNDLVGSANLDEIVRRMMEDQHKQMLRNLIHGSYDQAADETAAPPPAKPKTTTQTLPRVAPAPVVILPPTPEVAAEPADTVPPLATAVEPAVAPARAAARPEANPFADDTSITPPDFPVVPVAAEVEPTPIAASAVDRPTMTWAPLLRPTPAGAHPNEPGATLPRPSTLPPPTRSVSVRPPQPVAYSIWANTPAPERSSTPVLEPPPEVVAARELSEKPVELPVPTDTIFGEDLLDEKSLDEVILSYLADDASEG